LLIFTGARLSEILTLEWRHVDFERGMLTLADSKSGKKAFHLTPLDWFAIRRSIRARCTGLCLSAEATGLIE
jgi:integrase